MFPVYSITRPQEQSLRYSTQGYVASVIFACLHSKTNQPALEFVQIGCGFVLKQYIRKIRLVTTRDESKTGSCISLYTVHIIIKLFSKIGKRLIKESNSNNN